MKPLITLIIEQHICWKTALRAQGWLLRQYGERGVCAGGEVYDFPQPEQLARADRRELAPLKITFKRMDLIRDIAASVCAGAMDLESLGDLPPAQASERLLDIKGVGPWTANNVIGRAFGEYAVISANDVALQAAAQRYFYAGAGKKGARQTQAALDRFGEFAGIAGHFTLARWVFDNYAALDD